MRRRRALRCLPASVLRPVGGSRLVRTAKLPVGLPECSLQDASGAASPWDHSVHMGSSSLYGGAGAGHQNSAVLAGLDDIDFDPDAEEAAEAAEEAAAAHAQAVAAASQPASLAASRQPSRQPSPRAPLLAPAAVPPPPATLLHHLQPQLGASTVPSTGGPLAPGTLPRSPPRPPRPSSLFDSPLAPQTSVVMEDMENDVQFQSMFESKYDAGAAAAARRSPGISASGGANGSGPATQLAAEAGRGSALHLPSLAASPPGSAAAATAAAPAVNGGGGGGAEPEPAAVTSPNALLPTHISVFGDGITGLDLQHAAAVTRPAVQLPSHISEFGGDAEGAAEDAGEALEGRATRLCRTCCPRVP